MIGYYNANVNIEKLEGKTKTEFSIPFGPNCVVITVYDYDNYVNPTYELRVVDSFSNNITGEYFKYINPNVTVIPCENLAGAFALTDQVTGRSYAMVIK